MYQQVLSRFGHFNAIQLNEQVPLKDLIILALKEEDVDSNSNDDDTLKDKIAEVVSFWPFMTDCFTWIFCIFKNGSFYLLSVRVIEA